MNVEGKVKATIWTWYIFPYRKSASGMPDELIFHETIRTPQQTNSRTRFQKLLDRR